MCQIFKTLYYTYTPITMKKLFNLFSILTLASLMFSCELLGLIEEEKTEQQLLAELLDGGWDVESMEVNTSGSVSDVFPDFAISFTVNEDLSGGEITVDGDLVPNTDERLIGTTSSSEWRFDGSSLSEIVITNAEGNASNFQVDVNSTGTALTLTFDYEKPEGARMKGLVGTYTVELSK